jgi:raffinose/stachyose/melibiose transport system substrate-binding protein
LVSFQQQGYFGGSLDRYYTNSSADASASLAYGESAMKIEGSWWITDANLYFEESGMTWDWIPVPSTTGDASFTLGIGSTYSINASSEHPDAAAEYLDYYFSPEIQAQIKVECGLDPAPVELEAEQLEGLDEREAELLEQLGDATAVGDYGYTTWTFFPPRTQVYLYEAIERVWAGELTIEEYLAEAQTIFEEDLANDNIPPLPER